jgi:conjugative transposon TraN protein
LGIESQLNNVYAFGDYVFLDISFKNNTNLIYDIDKLKFSIDDKKVYKATNVQSIEIEPVFRLYDLKTFKKSYRNIFVFKKFTYPNNKVLNIRLIENQISGRTINLEIKYSDILQADTF